MSKTIVQTDAAPAAIGPYSRGGRSMQADRLRFRTNTVNPRNDFVDGDIAAQTERVMQNLEQVLLASGCTFNEVVRTTIFLKSMDDFAAVNEVYATRFPEKPTGACLCGSITVTQRR